MLLEIDATASDLPIAIARRVQRVQGRVFERRLPFRHALFRTRGGLEVSRNRWCPPVLCSGSGSACVRLFFMPGVWFQVSMVLAGSVGVSRSGTLFPERRPEKDPGGRLTKLSSWRGPPRPRQPRAPRSPQQAPEPEIFPAAFPEPQRRVPIRNQGLRA